MPYIRTIAAAAATAVALAFALSPAAARSCDDGNEPCAGAASQASPVKLDQFMKTWKPVAAKRAKVSKRAKKQKTAPRPAAKEVAEPVVAETAAPSVAESTLATTTAAESTIETDGIAVTSFNDLNELDAAADQVQIVAFNEVNEIDLAAPPPPAPSSETTGQSISETTAQSIVSPEQTPADNSWIGKLLLAMAGTIAVAGAARLWIA